MATQNKEVKKSALQGEITIGGVSLVQKAIFAKNLSVMLKAGLQITEALEITRESATGKLKKVLGHVLRAVESGNTLSDAFKEHPKAFSGLFVNAVYAGEKSGTLVENLENVATQLQKEKDLLSKVRSAMLYPIIVLIASFFLALGLSFVILPQITPLFEGLDVDLPFTTRAIISFSNFIQANGGKLILGIIGGLTLFLWTIRQKFSHPVTHWLLIHTPIVKTVVRSANVARFSGTLGMLIKSGVRVDEALEITHDAMGNYYYKRAIAHVSKGVARGGRLAENIDAYRDLFPLLVARMIKVGEESGQFEETFLYLAEFYEAEVDTATKALSTAIEPILLIGIGLIVGFLALSIITPIYEITGNIKR
ncbi:MAG: type II secretion system F family protein [bacterium]|nr:type II secretion system F family protein [bacterium]